MAGPPTAGTRRWLSQQAEPSRWWRRRGSNPLPPPCKGGALPNELRPLDAHSIAARSEPGAARNHVLSGQSSQEHRNTVNPVLRVVPAHGWQLSCRTRRNPRADGYSVVFQRNGVGRDIHLGFVLGEMNDTTFLLEQCPQRQPARGARPVELFVVLRLASRALVRHRTDTIETCLAPLDGARAPGTAYSRRRCRSRRTPPPYGVDRNWHPITPHDECWRAPS